MPGPGRQLKQDKAQMAHIRDAIGRRLRDEYDLAQPMPDRLAALVRQIEQAAPGAAVELRVA